MDRQRQTKSRTAPKGRPTPKRDKGSAQTGGTPTAATAQRPVTIGGLAWRTALAFFIMMFFTYAVFLMQITPQNSTPVILMLLAIPAVVTMMFVPEARTRGIYRWPTIWLIGFTSQVPVYALIAAQTWVLIRFWYVESRPQSPLKNRPRRVA